MKKASGPFTQNFSNQKNIKCHCHLRPALPNVLPSFTDLLIRRKYRCMAGLQFGSIYFANTNINYIFS